MDPVYWTLLAGLVVVAFVLGGVAAWFLVRRRHARRLRKRFGPEYDRITEERGDRRLAEEELLRREQRVKGFEIQSLAPEQRAEFAESWRRVQAAFVDTPTGAVADADDLLLEVMLARGYPMEEFDQRADDLSVDHADVVQSYRSAHALALRNHRGEAETEDLRQAMVHYRALFEELLEARVTDGSINRNHEEERR